MDDDLLKAARARGRWRMWGPRYEIARSPLEALVACEGVRMWLEELANNPILDHEAEHCVGEALRDLRGVRMYLRLASRQAP
jgi:hypothetical protein